MFDKLSVFSLGDFRFSEKWQKHEKWFCYVNYDSKK